MMGHPGVCLPGFPGRLDSRHAVHSNVQEDGAVFSGARVTSFGLLPVSPKTLGQAMDACGVYVEPPTDIV